MKTLVLLACAFLLLTLLVPGSSADFAEDFGKKLHRDLCSSGCVNIFHDSSEECVTACLNNDNSYKQKTPDHLTGPQICGNLCKFLSDEETQECTSACIKEAQEKAKAKAGK